MQIPHWIQLELRLSKGSPLLANAITSTPTWQYRLHIVQEIHLSFAVIRSLPYQLARIWLKAANGHQ